MSQPHGLKLKLKLPSSTPADPPSSADAAPSGRGVKLKLSLSGTGIRTSGTGGNGKDDQGLVGKVETEGREDGGELTEPAVEAHPTTKIKLNIGKLANHATATESMDQTPSAPEQVKHEDQGPEEILTSTTASPAKQGRGGATSRGKRAVTSGVKARGRGRPKGSGKGRGKSVVLAADGADGAEESGTDGGPMEVDSAPVHQVSTPKGPESTPQPVIKPDLETVPEPKREVQAGNSTANVISQPPIKPEPPIERPTTPAIVQSPPTAPTTSVTFAIPSPELSPAPRSQEPDPSSQFPTPTIPQLTLPRRSASVMSASGNLTAEGSAVPMTSELGTPTGGMEESQEATEAMLAEAAASGRVLFMGKGKPYLRAKKPLKDVLRKILADIRRKDSVSNVVLGERIGLIV